MISTDANGVHEIKQLRVFEPQYGMLVPNLKVKRAKKTQKHVIWEYLVLPRMQKDKILTQQDTSQSETVLSN